MRNANDKPCAAVNRWASMQPLLWGGFCAALAVLLMAAYVHTLNASVLRGQSWRQAQHAVALELARRMRHGAHPGADQYAFVDVP